MALQVKRGSNGTIPDSKLKNHVKKQRIAITAISKRDNKTDEIVAMQVLSQSQNEIINYIRSRGETPVDTFPGRVLQAALLRMEDICVVARTMGISEDAALAHVEQAESEVVEHNTADKNRILKPSTQAALSVVIDNVVREMTSKAGTQGLCEALDAIRKVTFTPKNHNSPVDNFTAARTVKMYNSFDISTDFPPPPSTPPTIPINPPPVNPEDDSKSIWDIIAAIGSSAGQVAGAVNSIGNSVSDIGSNIGAQSIQKYISDNWLKIFAFVLVIVVIIIILLRVTRNK